MHRRGRNLQNLQIIAATLCRQEKHYRREIGFLNSHREASAESAAIISPNKACTRNKNE